MGTAASPDPFEDMDWFKKEIDEIFIDSPFGYTDPDEIDRQVALFAKRLEQAPTGVSPYEEG